MASSIDATSGGIVSAGNSTAALDIKTGGTTAISIGTGQSVTITNLVLTDLSLASANITTLTGTTAGFTSANITTLTGTSATITNIFDGDGAVRAVPSVGAAKTAEYTLTVSDVGNYVTVGSGGGITLLDDVFTAGDVVSIFNDTSGTVTISCGITTAYLAGTDTDQASLTLATRGIATVLFTSASACVLTGNLTA